MTARDLPVAWGGRSAHTEPDVDLTPEDLMGGPIDEHGNVIIETEPTDDDEGDEDGWDPPTEPTQDEDEDEHASIPLGPELRIDAALLGPDVLTRAATLGLAREALRAPTGMHVGVLGVSGERTLDVGDLLRTASWLATGADPWHEDSEPEAQPEPEQDGCP